MQSGIGPAGCSSIAATIEYSRVQFTDYGSDLFQTTPCPTTRAVA